MVMYGVSKKVPSGTGNGTKAREIRRAGDTYGVGHLRVPPLFPFHWGLHKNLVHFEVINGKNNALPYLVEEKIQAVARISEETCLSTTSGWVASLSSGTGVRKIDTMYFEVYGQQGHNMSNDPWSRVVEIVAKERQQHFGQACCCCCCCCKSAELRTHR